MESMGRKQYLFIGLAVVLVGLAVAGGMLWVKLGGVPVIGNQAKDQVKGEKKTTIKVISWQPEAATLIYQDEQGQEQQVVIRPLKPMVVVPVFMLSI